MEFTFLYCPFDLLNFEKFINCIKCTELTNIGKQFYKTSQKSISSYTAEAFWVVTLLFESNFWLAYSYFYDIKHSKSRWLLWKLVEVKFWFPCKDMCYLSYNTNVIIVNIDFQKTDEDIKSPRRTGWISNILFEPVYYTKWQKKYWFVEWGTSEGSEWYQIGLRWNEKTLGII